MKAPPRNAAPLGPAYRYGYIEREGEARTRAIVIVDCSRYDGAAVRKLTAERGISPKAVRRLARSKAA